LLNKLNIERKLITKNAFETELNIGFVKRAAKEHNCFGRRLYIDVDLNIFPCVMERRISHGNLKEGMLFDIINNEICTFNKDRIFVCKDCEFRYTCFDCRPDSLGKRIDEKPWYCTYDPHKGVWADKKLFVKNLLSKNKEGC